MRRRKEGTTATGFSAPLRLRDSAFNPKSTKLAIRDVILFSSLTRRVAIFVGFKKCAVLLRFRFRLQLPGRRAIIER